YTEADVSDLVRDFDYKPMTKVQDGIKEFIKWYKNFYNID
ncbi:MAG: UDP-glucuronate 4-epimerase, partial [Rikenellaceae bacterium]|nr:UDP-glucuronate 4-epimerase [Rikenellaceae bacterium]